MPFAARPLARGQLPIVQGSIYTVPFGVTSYVKQVFLFNGNTVAQTIDLWLNTGGTALRWRRLVLQQNEAADVLEHGESVQLESSDSIEAVTTTAAAVDYTITGVEES